MQAKGSNGVCWLKSLLDVCVYYTGIGIYRKTKFQGSRIRGPNFQEEEQRWQEKKSKEP